MVTKFEEQKNASISYTQSISKWLMAHGPQVEVVDPTRTAYVLRTA